MARYQVYVLPTAWRELKALPGHLRQRVRRAIDDLERDPHPPQSQALQASGLDVELRRLRIDRWRIVYAIDETQAIVDILAVRKRPPYDYGDLAELLARILPPEEGNR